VISFRRSALRVVYGVLLLSAALLIASPVWSQTQEITFSLGGIPGQSRGLQGSGDRAQIAADRSLGINYGYRIVSTGFAALYGEIQFVALPNRPVAAANSVVSRSYASLYLTPGLRLKFFPASRLSPWAAIGGGYALYEQSELLSNGQNSADKFLNRGVFEYGGGLDYRLFHFLGLRGEVRDFLSGNPNLNAPLDSSWQHNVVASGGLIFRF
jgi:hypothetical protein